MRKKDTAIVSITLDAIMTICVLVGAFRGTTYPAWMLMIWVIIALFAHIDQLEQED